MKTLGWHALKPVRKSCFFYLVPSGASLTYLELQGIGLGLEFKPVVLLLILPSGKAQASRQLLHDSRNKFKTGGLIQAWSKCIIKATHTWPFFMKQIQRNKLYNLFSPVPVPALRTPIFGMQKCPGTVSEKILQALSGEWKRILTTSFTKIIKWKKSAFHYKCSLIHIWYNMEEGCLNIKTW